MFWEYVKIVIFLCVHAVQAFITLYNKQGVSPKAFPVLYPMLSRTATWKGCSDMFQPDFTVFDWKVQQGVRKTIVCLAVEHKSNITPRSGDWIAAFQWEPFYLLSSFIFSFPVMISEYSDNVVHSLIRACSRFETAFFWGHVMSCELIYDVSNLHWVALLFVGCAFWAYTMISVLPSSFKSDYITQWEYKRRCRPALNWNSLKDPFAEFSHIQGHQQFQ